MSTTPAPAVGQIVWFYKDARFVPHAAIIVACRPPDALTGAPMVDLAVFKSDGLQWQRNARYNAAPTMYCWHYPPAPGVQP